MRLAAQCLASPTTALCSGRAHPRGQPVRVIRFRATWMPVAAVRASPLMAELSRLGARSAAPVDDLVPQDLCQIVGRDVTDPAPAKSRCSQQSDSGTIVFASPLRFPMIRLRVELPVDSGLAGDRYDTMTSTAQAGESVELGRHDGGRAKKHLAAPGLWRADCRDAGAPAPTLAGRPGARATHRRRANRSGPARPRTAPRWLRGSPRS